MTRLFNYVDRILDRAEQRADERRANMDSIMEDAKRRQEELSVVVLRNNGEERLLLSSSPDLIPPLEFEPVAKSSFMAPAPVRGIARR